MLLGHRGSGKTQLAEILLHTAGVVRSPGRVDLGTSLLDHEAEARAGRGSVAPAWAWLPWQDDVVVHLADTPGDDAAAYPTELARAGADLDVLVVGAPDGLEAAARARLEDVRSADRPLMAVLTKLDRPADVEGLLATMGEVAGCPVVPLQLPVWEDGALVGLVDLLGDRLLRFDPDGGGAFSPEPVPAPRWPAVRAAREALIEAIAMADDDLLEAYLEHLDLPEDAAWTGLQHATRTGQVVPVMLTSAGRHVGAAPLLDAVVRLAPDPAAWRMPPLDGREPELVLQWVGTRLDEDGSLVRFLRVLAGEARDQQVVHHGSGGTARLHKLYQVRGPRRAKARHRGPGAIVATWDALPGRPGDAYTDGPPVDLVPPPVPPPMAWLQVRPVRADHLEELSDAVARLAPLDPSVQAEVRDDGTLRLAGRCRRQLEAWVDRVRRRQGLPLEVELPPVGYVERPRAAVRRAAGIHRKEKDGLVAEYGEIWLDLEPSPAPDVPRFVPACDDERVPSRFLDPAARGAVAALGRGPTAGYPVLGAVLRCVDGDYDCFESTEEHFEAAGAAAAREAIARSGTELWEPWRDATVHVRPDDVGAVLEDLLARRGRVQDVEVGQREASIRVRLPDRELFTLSGRLGAVTHGTGWFVVGAVHYDRVPSHLVGEAVACSPHRVSARPVERTPPGRATPGSPALAPAK